MTKIDAQLAEAAKNLAEILAGDNLPDGMEKAQRVKAIAGALLVLAEAIVELSSQKSLTSLS